MLLWRIIFGFVTASTIAALKPSRQTLVPNAYMLQLDSESHSYSSNPHVRSLNAHETFHKRAAHIDYIVRREFRDPSLFFGLSIHLNENLTRVQSRDLLSAIPDVVSVYPVYLVQVPRLPPGNGNRTTPTKTNPPVSSPVDVGNSSTRKITGNLQIGSTHLMSDVSKVHALGIKGRGIKIALIDTGVDYRHPSLGGGFGPGHKIAGGYAFVQDNFTGFGSTPTESSDPLVTCKGGGHGSHVSGIIAMQDPVDVGFGLVGVAPEASLYMYRVFSCYGIGTTDIIIAAMQRAAADGVDIISMSLALGEDWPTELDDPLRQVTAGLVQKGIAVIAANGNAGYLGVNTDASPAIGVDVIAVGSVANTYFPVTYEASDSRGNRFQYASVWPINRTQPLDVFVLSMDSPLGCYWDGLNDTANKVDMKSTIVLISGKLCNSQEWEEYNFTYIGILNDVSSPDPWGSEYNLYPLDEGFPTQLINFGGSGGIDAAKILEGYKSSGGYGKYKLTFGNPVATSTQQITTGGRMSNYSSFGPSLDTWAMKPELSAPGGNILSTWPLGFLGGYSIISGTSMAAPFVAGCYALVKSKFPQLSVAELTALLQSTSRPVPSVVTKELLCTTVHQGSGLINPYRAITFESRVSPWKFAIGSEDDFMGHPKNITITNKSKQGKTYTLAHQGSGYVEAYPYPDLLDYDSWYSDGQPQYSRYGSATFSSLSLNIPAGQSKSFSFQLKSPPSVDVTRNPYFTGYINISSPTERFSVPYIGLPYSRSKVKIFGVKSPKPNTPAPFTTFKILANYDASGSITGVYYEANTGLQVYNQTDYNSPYIIVNLQFLVQHFRLDILPVDTIFIPDYYGFDRSRTFPYQAPSALLSSTFLGYPTYGNSNNYTNMAPMNRTVSWEGNQIIPDPGKGNAFIAPVGDYRLLISALRWKGDEGKREAWETWLSPIVRFIR